MSDRENGWKEWSKYVIKAIENLNNKVDNKPDKEYITSELEKINSNIEKLTDHVNHQNEAMRKRLVKLETENARKEPQWGLMQWFGSVAGAVIISTIISLILMRVVG